MICFQCQKIMDLPLPLGRGDVCPHCRFDARVCKNCEFYDVQAYNECREPSAERVIDKEKACFCDFFKPNQKKDGNQKAKLDPKGAANALFKKG